MRANSCHRVGPLIVIVLLLAFDVSISVASYVTAHRLPIRLDPSPGYPQGASPPSVTEGEIEAAYGGEAETRLLAQADTVKAAEFLAKSAVERTPEEKNRVKTAVVLLSVLSGIALSGLLLIIAAISIRGLQRKLAGPTRLDREPADLFPPPPGPVPDEPPAAGTAAPTDASSQETRLT